MKEVNQTMEKTKQEEIINIEKEKMSLEKKIRELENEKYQYESTIRSLKEMQKYWNIDILFLLN